MSEFLSQSQYAKRRGVSPKTITKWKQANMLVMSADGLLVDVMASDEKLKKYRPDGLSHTANDGTRRINQYHTEATLAPKRQQHRPSPEDDDYDAEELLNEGKADLQEAKRVKENYLALQEKLEYQIQQGKYIEVEEAKKLFFEEGRRLRDAWINWPIRVVPHIAAELDIPADKLLNVLNNYVYEHLNDLGDIAELNTGADND